MKLIFLDIDGVLNAHRPYRANGYNGIELPAMKALNELVHATAAQIVISSAWRYMIIRGAMTLEGFKYMLITHGLTNLATLHGYTVSDEQIDRRADQITEYLRAASPVHRYVVLDDGSDLRQPDGSTLTGTLTESHGHNFIKIDGLTGLCMESVPAILERLR